MKQKIKKKKKNQTRLISSVQFILSVVSDSWWPHGLQHALQASLSITSSRSLTHLMHFIEAELWVLDTWRVSQALYFLILGKGSVADMLGPA